MASLKRHEAANVNALQRSDIPATPAPAPALKSPVRRLGQAVTFGALLFGAFSAIIAAVELRIGPFGLPLICSAWAALIIYGISLIGMDLLILALEQFTDQDINQDGVVGPPPVDRLIPVFHGRNVRAVNMPEPPPDTPGTRLIQLDPSTDKIEKQRLWDYLIGAFETSDWSRDGDAKGVGCVKLGITTKIHPKVREFVKMWDKIDGVTVWGLTGEESRPTLEHRLRSLGWTGTNERERDERNGESGP